LILEVGLFFSVCMCRHEIAKWQTKGLPQDVAHINTQTLKPLSINLCFGSVWDSVFLWSTHLTLSIYSEPYSCVKSKLIHLNSYPT